MTAKLFSLDAVYVFTGIVLFVFAAMTFTDRSNSRRIGSGCFWLVLGVIFAFGSLMPHWLTGLLVLLLVAIDGLGRVKAGEQDIRVPGKREACSPNMFIPVLAIPLVTFGFAIVFRQLGLDANRGALVGLGFGGLAAMLIGLRLTGSTWRVMMSEGRRLNEAMGAVNILPQLLASLGVIFAAA
ncbi:MAG TPA: DUF979 family protein, partial [Blastocatellia bacterium]|nr:DUF979 family protein [Blastocatellia bacterium]